MPSLRNIYLSPLARPISALLNLWAIMHRPRMVYGYRDKSSGGKFQKHTRVSSTATISDPRSVSIADHVWIWHYTIIDGSNGVCIEEGAQIGAWVGIFSHGSQIAVRLLGRSYIDIPREERPGYTRGQVRIGAYSFIGAGALIMPGTTLGKGCLVAAGSVVSGDFPDFSLIKGSPAQRAGDVRRLDKRYLNDPEIRETYFDQETIAHVANGTLDGVISDAALPSVKP